MSKSTILLDSVSATTSGPIVQCGREISTLTIAVNGTTAGAWAATGNVWQWLSGGKLGQFQTLLASFTLSQSSPSYVVDLLTAASNISVDVTFSANPSADRLTVVVEG